MSRSYKVKPRFTDPRDIDYLSFFGAARQMMAMQNARVAVEPFALNGVAAAGEPVQDWPALPAAGLSANLHARMPEAGVKEKPFILHGVLADEGPVHDQVVPEFLDTAERVLQGSQSVRAFEEPFVLDDVVAGDKHDPITRQQPKFEQSQSEDAAVDEPVQADESGLAPFDPRPDPVVDDRETVKESPVLTPTKPMELFEDLARAMGFSTERKTMRSGSDELVEIFLTKDRDGAYVMAEGGRR